ncbi:hypothetical protein [Micromonospora zhanjiangensis]
MSGRPATRRFDVRRHRRVAGLFDLILDEPVPAESSAAGRDARQVADLVRRSAEPADDVRVLAGDGGGREALFREVAGLLGRDVFVTPKGADIRHQGSDDEADGLYDAVALDRSTRQPVDWLVIQPPDLSTPLPGWFAVDGGVVRPRDGIVCLPMSDGLALATRADFVTRRSAAYRLRTGFPGLATVAVTVRAGAFLTSDYRGTQRTHTGLRLAAVLAELLYGADLRLWLTWPPEQTEQRQLEANVQELADTVGATVWTPPVGGAAQLLDDGHDLRAVDSTGTPGRWRCHRPTGLTGTPAFRSDPDGRLVPVAPAEPAADQVTPAPVAAGRPEPVTVRPSERPSVLVEQRRAPASGVAWLRPGQCVNADPFDVFVAADREPRQAVENGLPSPELFLIGRLEPRPAPSTRAATHLFRIRVEPGGAIPMASMRSHIPANLQHLLAGHDAYLLPAGRLDRLRLLAGYQVSAAGALTAAGEFDAAPVRLDCDGSWHGVAGLPNDVPRWPGSRAGRAYALVPARGSGPPRRWLRLYRREPAVVAGRLLLEVQVPTGRAIDVGATAETLTRLPAVRSRAGTLWSAGVELIVPARHYDRLRVDRVAEATESSWRRRRNAPNGPLPTVLSALQSPRSAAEPVRAD